MTYNSLFDRPGSLFNRGSFEILRDEVYSVASYTGTLEDVFSVLKRSASLSRIFNRDFDNVLLYTPRMIRAFVDNKIENPSSESERLLRDSIALGLKIYSSEENLERNISDLQEDLRESGYADLLERPLQQKADFTTFDSTRAPNLRRVSSELISDLGGKDILFIALGHGGVTGGMDVFLRYCSSSGSSDSQFYVTRFSHHKLNDSEPQLTESEIRYLRESANQRVPIIFDEDLNNGSTLKIARQFFADSVFEHWNFFLAIADTWRHKFPRVMDSFTLELVPERHPYLLIK